MEIYKFLPIYNSIESPGFDKDINNLEEFRQYKLEKYEPFPSNKGDLMAHQKMISTFINPYTIYDGLLIIHEMGTGKTCTAVSAAEAFLQDHVLKYPHTILKNIIVLTRGEGLQNNFINEIANVCTKGQYLTDANKFIGNNRFKKIKKKCENQLHI